MKKILIILAVIAAFAIFFIISSSKTSEEQEIAGETFQSLCFYQENNLESGFQDRTWLRVENTSGETGVFSVSGQYSNIPAEKDSKKGDFIGAISLDVQNPTYLQANTYMTAVAEGMTTAEEFYFEFNPIEAKIGFGEMVDRGDGVYVYADKENINYSQTLPSISCDELTEKITVEKYVRENIQTLFSEEPVLGGTWYVVNLVIDSQANSGIVTYEDGHIQNITSFVYEYSDQGVVILSSENITPELEVSEEEKTLDEN